MKPHLYRHFDAEGSLLYVGVSICPDVRLQQHLNSSDWAAAIATVETAVFETRGEAEAAERRAIEEEGPIYNIRYNRIPPPPRKTVQSGVYLRPEVHSALAKLAIDLKCSRQSLTAEAVEELLKKRGVTVETEGV